VHGLTTGQLSVVHGSRYFPLKGSVKTPINSENRFSHLLDLSTGEMEQTQGGAICHAKTVLAWARVDGVSPLRDDVIVDGKVITAENWRS
jgi:hypothetical protein